MDNGEFIELIKSGNTEAVSHVVRTGQVSLRALEQNMDEQPSFLIAAIRKSDIAMVRCLLELGADPEAVSYAVIDGPGTAPYQYARKFFWDDFAVLMTPYLGKIPYDEEIEEQRRLNYIYFGRCGL